MRRVLLIGDYPPPLGGVAVHVAQLHARLERDGFDVRVLDIGKGRARRLGADMRAGVEGVPDARTLASRLDAYAREGRLFHLHTSGNNPKAYLVAGLVAAVAKVRNVPSVVTLHSGLLPGLLNTQAQLRFLAKVCLAGYSRVIAVSSLVREALERVGIPAARIEECPAFIPTEVRPGDLPLALANVVSTERPILSYAHHPSPVYGRGIFFEALAQLRRGEPSVVAAVFGPGTNEAAFRADAERAGVSDALVLLGEIPHQAALAVMSASSVFVRPTTADGDSVSVREALILGVPCVASDVAPRPPGTHLFRAGQPSSLAQAIEAALEDRREPRDQPDAAAVVERLYMSMQESEAHRAAV